MKSIKRAFSFSIFLSLVLVGCGGNAPKESTPLLLFAAASTTDAVEDILADFEKSTGLDVVVNFASSGALAKQIESGADADVYISANQKWMDFLEEKKLTEKRVEFLSNALSIVVPNDSELTVGEPGDLQKKDFQFIAVGDPESVPAGAYGKQALSHFQLWDALKPKIVSAATVRQALAYVERGEVEAGIVYETDALSSKDVKTAYRFPESSHKPIRYSLATVKRDGVHAKADILFDYFSRETARDCYKKHGFQFIGER